MKEYPTVHVLYSYKEGVQGVYYSYDEAVAEAKQLAVADGMGELWELYGEIVTTKAK